MITENTNNIPDIRLRFRIYGDDFSLDEFSKIVGFEPNYFWVKGGLSSPYQIKQDSTLWSYVFAEKKPIM